MTRWLDIPGFAGYQASDEGKIRNASTGRLLHQRSAGGGAMQVGIGKTTRLVHDLVARAFYGRPPAPGYRAKHLSGTANTPDNIVWTGGPRAKEAPAPPPQSPTLASDLEAEYDRVRLERLSMVELMQT